MSRALADTVSKLIRPVVQRVRSMVGRALLEALDDDKLLQTVKLQILEGMVREDVEHFQPGGLTHVALVGAEGLFIAIGGDTGHGAVVGLANRDKRPTQLSAGETQVYAAGDGGVLGYLYAKADGTVQLIPAGSGFVELGGASGNLAARADLVDTRIDALELWAAAVKDKFDNHDHVETGGTTNKVPSPAGQIIALPPQASVACTKVKVT